MGVRSRLFEGHIRRALAVLGAAAISLTLVPSLAQGQPEDGVDPFEGCPVDPPAADFTDRDDIPQAHRDNVDCAALFEIVLGFTDGTYGPALEVRRDQMASFIARTLDAADVDLPAAGAGQDFTDVPADSAHRDNIRRLAAADIVLGGPAGQSDDEYGPALSTRRDQMTSFIVRAAEFAFDEEFGSDQQQFDDVPEGNVHFENINYAAEQQIVLGFDEDTFGPDRNTRRDQMASFVVRLLNFLTVPSEVAITDQSAEQASIGEETSVTASVFTQYRDTGGDEARFPDGEDVTFTAEHSADAGVVAPPEQTVESDENGDAQFTFTTAQTGTVTVTATIDGPGGNFAAADGDSDSAEVEFVLEEPNIGENPGTIAGAVEDPDGEPVTGAIISIEDGTTTATLTGTDGEYQSTPLEPGDYTVEVTGIEGVILSDCEPSAHEVTVAPDEDVDGVDFVCEAALQEL